MGAVPRGGQGASPLSPAGIPGRFAPGLRAGASPCTRPGPSALDPTPFSLLRQRKGGKRKATLLRSPFLACGQEGFPALLEARPRPELAALACGSLRSNRLAEPEGMRACGTRAGLLCCSAAQTGGEQPTAKTNTNSQQPDLGSLTAGGLLVLAVRLFGCLGPHSPSAPPSSARTRGSAPQARLVIWLRAACLSGASQRRAQRVLRDPRVLSSAGNPSRPQAGRGERSAGSPFFSPLFFGEAKKRGLGPGAKLLVGVQGRSALGLGLLGVQERSALVRGPGGGSPLGAATLARRTRVGPAP